MTEQPESKETVQTRAEGLMARLGEILAKAQGEEESKVFDKPINTTANALVIKPTEATTKKTLIAIHTGTFLDTIFLSKDDKPINGIPFGSNSIIVGMPSSGKSLLMVELALALTNNGHKVCLTTSEEAFRTDSARLDLETRMQERAKILGLDWQKVHDNLVILDCVSHAELRDFDTYISALRTIVEQDKIEILLVDSLTQIEDSRGQIKNRLLAICRYTQTHGLLAIFVSQRSGDDPDSIGSLAGGISLSYAVDIVMEMDFKKAWTNDQNLKADTGCKQGDVVYFFKVLKNRLCKSDMRFFAYTITSDGLIRLNHNV